MSEIERVPVTSSVLTSVGYDGQRRILALEFHGGRLYQYHDVPPETHTALMQAESHGSYFGREIRNAGFRCERLK